MKSLSFSAIHRGSMKLPRVTLALCLFAGLLYLLFDPAPAMLVFDRQAITQGEWWRLFSGHWVHSDAEHLLWNLGALLVLGTLLEFHARIHVVPLMLVSSLAIDAWLWWFAPELTFYCGLSGILNALMSALLYLQWRQRKHWYISFVGVCAAAKIVIETLANQSLFTHTAWQSLPEVHLIGFLIGIAYALHTHDAEEAKWSNNPGR